MKLVIHYRNGGVVERATIQAEALDVDVASLGDQISRARREDAALSFTFGSGGGIVVPGRSIELVEVRADD
jgi:hypothetical protein